MRLIEVVPGQQSIPEARLFELMVHVAVDPCCAPVYAEVPAPPRKPLSTMEHKVLALGAEGASMAATDTELELPNDTDYYRRGIFRKLGADNMAEATAIAD